MSFTGKAFAVTPYSTLALRPAAPLGRSSIDWYAWDDWAKKNGILDKHGEPSLSKVKMLIKHHYLSATISKCIRTFHTYHHITNKPIYRKISRIVVTERFPEQIEWKPEDWQELYKSLFSKSQGNKARGKRHK